MATRLAAVSTEVPAPLVGKRSSSCEANVGSLGKMDVGNCSKYVDAPLKIHEIPIFANSEDRKQVCSTGIPDFLIFFCIIFPYLAGTSAYECMDVHG